MNDYEFDRFMTITIGILVLFVRSSFSNKIEFLRNYNIPEPVTGFLMAAFFVDISNAFVIQYVISL